MPTFGDDWLWRHDWHHVLAWTGNHMGETVPKFLTLLIPPHWYFHIFPTMLTAAWWNNSRIRRWLTSLNLLGSPSLLWRLLRTFNPSYTLLTPRTGHRLLVTQKICPQPRDGSGPTRGKWTTHPQCHLVLPVPLVVSVWTSCFHCASQHQSACRCQTSPLCWNQGYQWHSTE